MNIIFAYDSYTPQVRVRVAVPAGASPGEEEVSVISAVSRSRPAVSASATGRTKAGIPLFFPFVGGNPF
jgi:hypothetical protein